MVRKVREEDEMKKLVGVLVACVLVLFAGMALAMDVTLAWDPNSETDLAGYNIYYSTITGVPAANRTKVAIPLTTAGFVRATPEYQVKNLTRGTMYYFVVTAYDTEVPSLESGYSNQVQTNGGPGSPAGTRIKVVVEVQVP